jgi:hypothetical protein
MTIFIGNWLLFKKKKTLILAQILAIGNFRIFNAIGILTKDLSSRQNVNQGENLIKDYRMARRLWDE